MVKIKVEVSKYQIEWLEQALYKQERGQVVDDGTLATLGQIFVDGAEL